MDAEHHANSTNLSVIESLDETLSKPAIEYPQQAELMQLRYFAGSTLEVRAEILGVTARTADAWWAYARAWLTVVLGQS